MKKMLFLLQMCLLSTFELQLYKLEHIKNKYVTMDCKKKKLLKVTFYNSTFLLKCKSPWKMNNFSKRCFSTDNTTWDISVEFKKNNYQFSFLTHEEIIKNVLNRSDFVFKLSQLSEGNYDIIKFNLLKLNNYFFLYYDFNIFFNSATWKENYFNDVLHVANFNWCLEPSNLKIYEDLLLVFGKISLNTQCTVSFFKNIWMKFFVFYMINLLEDYIIEEWIFIIRHVPELQFLDKKWGTNFTRLVTIDEKKSWICSFIFFCISDGLNTALFEYYDLAPSSTIRSLFVFISFLKQILLECAKYNYASLDQLKILIFYYFNMDILNVKANRISDNLLLNFTDSVSRERNLVMPLLNFNFNNIFNFVVKLAEIKLVVEDIDCLTKLYLFVNTFVTEFDFNTAKGITLPRADIIDPKIPFNNLVKPAKKISRPLCNSDPNEKIFGKTKNNVLDIFTFQPHSLNMKIVKKLRLKYYEKKIIELSFLKLYSFYLYTFQYEFFLLRSKLFLTTQYYTALFSRFSVYNRTYSGLFEKHKLYYYPIFAWLQCTRISLVYYLINYYVESIPDSWYKKNRKYFITISTFLVYKKKYFGLRDLKSILASYLFILFNSIFKSNFKIINLLRQILDWKYRDKYQYGENSFLKNFIITLISDAFVLYHFYDLVKFRELSRINKLKPYRLFKNYDRWLDRKNSGFGAFYSSYYVRILRSQFANYVYEDILRYISLDGTNIFSKQLKTQLFSFYNKYNFSLDISPSRRYLNKFYWFFIQIHLMVPRIYYYKFFLTLFEINIFIIRFYPVFNGGVLTTNDFGDIEEGYEELNFLNFHIGTHCVLRKTDTLGNFIKWYSEIESPLIDFYFVNQNKYWNNRVRPRYFIISEETRYLRYFRRYDYKSLDEVRWHFELALPLINFSFYDSFYLTYSKYNFPFKFFWIKRTLQNYFLLLLEKTHGK